MPAPEAIRKLVENFSTHIEHYKSVGYNETELRREYLAPFWKALGWDIDNEQGYADAYKDVIHADAIKVGGCLPPRKTCPVEAERGHSCPVSGRTGRGERGVGGVAWTATRPSASGGPTGTG